jgi:hypothetical protein
MKATIDSIYNCPACGHQLLFEPKNNIIFCGFGPCPVDQMNDGIAGANQTDAFERLILLLECLTDARTVKPPFGGWHYQKNRQVLPKLYPTGTALLPAPFVPTSPNWENSDISKLAQPTIDEITGSD